MQLTPEHRAHLQQLLKNEQHLEAIKYIRQTFQVNLPEANGLWYAFRKGRIKAGQEIAPGGFRPPQPFPMVNIFIYVGILLIVIGTGIVVYQQSRLADAQSVQGEVVSMIGGGRGMYAPVVAYDWQGARYFHESNTYSKPPAYEVGETVELYIDANGEPFLAGFLDLWLAPMILWFIGSFFVGLALLIKRMA